MPAGVEIRDPDRTNHGLEPESMHVVAALLPSSSDRDTLLSLCSPRRERNSVPVMTILSQSLRDLYPRHFHPLD